MKILDLERKKTWLPGFLDRRFGGHYAQISTDTSMKIRSAVKDVNRMTHGRVLPEIEKLAGKFLDPPQGIPDREFVMGYESPEGDWVPGTIESGDDPALIEYTKAFPAEWEIVKKCLGVTKTKGRHACGFVICDEPIQNFLPLTQVGGVNCTQYTAGSVEAVGGLKMDFLVINSLKDIAGAIRLIQDRSGLDIDWKSSRPGTIEEFLKGLDEKGRSLKEVPSMTLAGKRVPLYRIVPWQGQLLDIWDLPEVQGPFRDICEGATESVFQFGTPGAIKWLRHFDRVRHVDADGTVHKALHSIEDLAAFTALDRPGPLDAYVEDETMGVRHNMLVEYARRASGQKPIGSFPILEKLFPETLAVLVYQEQLQRAFQEIGQTTGIEANNFRTDVGKKKMKKVMAWKQTFMKGALETVGAEEAEQLWESMVTFGQYGFNKSHSVCYVVIGYACAFLKHFYPLEWWTSVMQNAKKEEVEGSFWNVCGHLINLPDAALSKDDWEIVGDRIQAPLSLLKGVGPKAHEELNSLRPFSSMEEFLQKIEDRKVALGVNQPVIVKKTGLQKIDKKTLQPVFKLKKGRSALHSGIIKKLIVSGAADSLFENDLDINDKLQQYLWTNARITGTIGKKSGQPKEKIEPKYSSLTPLALYQIRKEILPAYSENLFPAVSRTKVHGLSNEHGSWTLKIGGDYATVVLAKALDFYDNLDSLPQGGVKLAVAGYVQEFKTWKYAGGSKEAAKFLVDIEGVRREFIKWPDKSGKLARQFKDNGDLAGAVILFAVSKWQAGKPWNIDDIRIAQMPIGAEALEESRRFPMKTMTSKAIYDFQPGAPTR